jgi:hypothetical protein
MSELQAGKYVVEHFYGDERDQRKNGNSTGYQWHRYRARALIVGFRYFVATGTLLIDRRGLCKGKSHVFDPVVQAWCREIIAEFPGYFSARTFRDKISVKLANNGYIKYESKIGRSVAVFYLHQLGLHLAHPKKGIYKDGHERPDTVLSRKAYTSVLCSFKDRECCYTGNKLETMIPPKVSHLPEVIRIYHDECIYASHEGALTLWVHEGEDPKYKKPRGAVIMCSGFICRCHGMMKIYDDEIDEFLRWTSSRACNGFVSMERAHFPMSTKVFKEDRISNTRFERTRNMLSSFTTIMPGKGKDDYWDNNDMCAHLAEAAAISQWVHRKPDGDKQSDIYFIFDGSSNHGARADDALHVGAGINREPGGKNAPGARASNTHSDVPKMCDGWYTDKVTLRRVEQVCTLCSGPHSF